MKYQKHILIGSIFTFLFVIFGWSQTDRYRVMWNGDPATTMTVGWDLIEGDACYVYYGTKNRKQDTSKYAFKHGIDARHEAMDMVNCFSRLKDLKPNTAYYFVIGNSKGISPWFWFQTAPAMPTDRLSFIAGGDSRNNRIPRQNANKLVAKLRPHAVFFAGDMTNGDSPWEWQDWFRDWQLTISHDGRMTPIIAARGNHERSNNSIFRLFDTNPKVYSALTFCGNLLRAYTLNTESVVGGEQTNWLKRDLNDHCDITWRMAQYHKPIRPHVSFKREGDGQYEHWADLFYRYNVNLVVECDAHTAKTTWPIRPDLNPDSDEGFIRDDGYGTTYVGEGCWGAPLRGNDDDKSWTRASGSFNQFKWIFVDQEKIEVKTVIIGESSHTDSVESISPDNIFSTPRHLNIWDPPTGSTVKVTRPHVVANLISPAEGRTVNSFPAQLTLEAAASSFGGAVRTVEFFINGEQKGEDKEAPYLVPWTMEKPGDYDIQVIAVDETGGRRFACPVRIVGDDSSLEVDWVSFEVRKARQDGVVVYWKTTQDFGADHYAVERAGKNYRFSAIHKEESKDKNGSENQYVFVDKEPLVGVSYYRLKAVNLDGGIKYSSIENTWMSPPAGYYLNAYPSPIGVDKILTVEIGVPEKERVDFYLIDSRGKEVYYLNKVVQKGQHHISLNPGPIPGGIYYLKVDFANKTQVEKIIFQ